MSRKALQLLKWLREVQTQPKDLFFRGYVFGAIDATFNIESWESAYLQAIRSRIAKGLPV